MNKIFRARCRWGWPDLGQRLYSKWGSCSISCWQHLPLFVYLFSSIVAPALEPLNNSRRRKTARNSKLLLLSKCHLKSYNGNEIELFPVVSSQPYPSFLSGNSEIRVCYLWESSVSWLNNLRHEAQYWTTVTPRKVRIGKHGVVRSDEGEKLILRCLLFFCRENSRASFNTTLFHSHGTCQKWKFYDGLRQIVAQISWQQDTSGKALLFN